MVPLLTKDKDADPDSPRSVIGLEKLAVESFLKARGVEDDVEPENKENYCTVSRWNEICSDLNTFVNKYLNDWQQEGLYSLPEDEKSLFQPGEGCGCSFCMVKQEYSDVVARFGTALQVLQNQRTSQQEQKKEDKESLTQIKHNEAKLNEEIARMKAEHARMEEEVEARLAGLNLNGSEIKCTKQLVTTECTKNMEVLLAKAQLGMLAERKEKLAERKEKLAERKEKLGAVVRESAAVVRESARCIQVVAAKVASKASLIKDAHTSANQTICNLAKQENNTKEIATQLTDSKLKDPRIETSKVVVPTINEAILFDEQPPKLTPMIVEGILKGFADFLSASFKKAQKARRTKITDRSFPKNIVQTVKEILNWKPGVTRSTKMYIPEGYGLELEASHPVLCAIMHKVALIINASKSTASQTINVLHEQNFWAGKDMSIRRIDFLVNSVQEHLKAVLAASNVVPVEVKPYGSVELFEMELLNVGTEDVKVVLRSTKPRRLFDKDATTAIMGDAASGFEGGGFELLAALMSCSSTEVPPLNQMVYEDATSKFVCDVTEYLGAGGYSFAFKLDENSFVKIPRTPLSLPGTAMEMECLEHLNKEKCKCIPKAETKLGKVVFRRGCMTSYLKALRLTGIVGSPASEGIFNEDELECVFDQIKLALEHAHNKGIVHLDVRPSNIIWHRDTMNDTLRVQLCDWGCAGSMETFFYGFRGFEPYAHDEILKKKTSDKWKPVAKYDIASLVFTMVSLIGKKCEPLGVVVNVDSVNNAAMEANCIERKKAASLTIKGSRLKQSFKDELLYCLENEEWMPPDQPRKPKRRTAFGPLTKIMRSGHFVAQK